MPGFSPGVAFLITEKAENSTDEASVIVFPSFYAIITA